MRKVIQFEVAADFALYQRPDSRSQTYTMPTPGAIRGMVKAVSHDNKVWVVPLKVELLTEPKTILISQHMLLGAQIKKGRKPNPNVFARDGWSPDLARDQLVEFCEASRGLHRELIMKDISTVRYDPRRLWEWAEMAMEVAEDYAN